MHIDDRLEIAVKQAPISKIVIHNDRIEIIRGKKYPIVEREFKIINENFLKKYLSFPRFIKETINKENNKGYILDGYHVKDNLPRVADDQYDNFESDEYFEILKGDIEVNDAELILTEYIDSSNLLLFGFRTINNYKLYNMQILSYYDGCSSTVEDDIEQFAQFNGIKVSLSVEFIKEDCVYILNDKVSRDFSKDRVNSWMENFHKKGNQIISTDPDVGFFITKENNKKSN